MPTTESESEYLLSQYKYATGLYQFVCEKCFFSSWKPCGGSFYSLSSNHLHAPRKSKTARALITTSVSEHSLWDYTMLETVQCCSRSLIPAVPPLVVLALSCRGKHSDIYRSSESPQHRSSRAVDDFSEIYGTGQLEGLPGETGWSWGKEGLVLRVQPTCVRSKVSFCLYTICFSGVFSERSGPRTLCAAHTHAHTHTHT